MKVDKIKVHTPVHTMRQVKLLNPMTWLYKLVNLIKGDFTYRFWWYKINPINTIDLSFNNPRNEDELILSTGIIRGSAKLLKKIEKAFVNNKLSITVITPEEIIIKNNTPKSIVLDFQAFKEAAQDKLKKVA